MPTSSSASESSSSSSTASSAGASASATTASLSHVLSPEGWQLLTELSASARYRPENALEMATQLRAQGHAPELVAAVLTQLKLRQKAAGKFGPFAHHMVLTEAGLEQATRMSVAARHAHRFSSAGIRHVADLGCGLGADSMALAAIDIRVTAVEADEITAAAATMNLMPFPQAQVIAADAQSWLRQRDATNATDANDTDAQSPVEGYWLDPARRTVSSSGSARLFDPEAFSPPLSFVEELADRGEAVGVKLGPGIPHASVPATAEAQWISVDGDVVEVSLWFNQLRRPDIRRSALVLTTVDEGTEATGELTSTTDFGASLQAPVAAVAGVGGYVYEPDGAVIRAGLVSDLIVEHFPAEAHARLLDEHIAYFCADILVQTPFARSYQIKQVMPYNIKGLRTWARDTQVGRVDIKKRGIDVTPESVRRQILAGNAKNRKKNPGVGATAPRHATLILTRVGEERLAIEVEPVDSTAQPRGV